jgi:hypothetical protein
MRFRRAVWIVLGGAVAVSAALGATPAVADNPLTLDQAVTQKTAVELADRQDCAAVPGGTQAGSDGWVFDQPVAGASAIGYAIGYDTGNRDHPAPIVLGVLTTGLVQFPIDPTGGGTAGAPVPAPPGVSGGLIDGGQSGGWLRTPAGWTLLPGALELAAPSDQTTFHLTAVCAAVTASPSASSSPSSSPSPSASPTATATEGSTPTTPPASPELPVTGTDIGMIAGVGVLSVLIGVVLVLRARRVG